MTDDEHTGAANESVLKVDADDTASKRPPLKWMGEGGDDAPSDPSSPEARSAKRREDEFAAKNHADNMLKAARQTANATAFIAWIVGVWAVLTVVGMYVVGNQVYDEAKATNDAAAMTSTADCEERFGEGNEKCSNLDDADTSDAVPDAPGYDYDSCYAVTESTAEQCAAAYPDTAPVE